MSRVKETRFLVPHQSCESKCGLNKSVCDSKQKWNHDEFWFECKELDDWGSFKKDYIWNPSKCDCDAIRYVQLMNIQILKLVLAKNF